VSYTEKDQIEHRDALTRLAGAQAILDAKLKEFTAFCTMGAYAQAAAFAPALHDCLDVVLDMTDLCAHFSRKAQGLQ
jgi:hypothetical protein